MYRIPDAQRTIASLALLLLGSTATLAAQPRDSAAVVRIRVVTQGDVPVPLAEVTLQRQTRIVSARTDSTGTARFDALEGGMWRAAVRRIGVQPAAVDLRLGPGENAFTILVSEHGATLSGMRIVSNRAYSARLDDFEIRRIRGDASAVITRETIDRRNPVQLSQVLRGLAGLRIGDSAGYTVAISTRGAKPSRATNGAAFGMVQCVMRVAVDGTLLPPLTNIDAMVPSDVHGIEVFYGPARMPQAFAGLRTDSWCGLVAIWTRDRH